MSDRCKSGPLGGGQCDLEAGHDGLHHSTTHPYGMDKEPFVFEWSDESQRRLHDRYGSRFD